MNKQGFPGGSVVKNPRAEMQVPSLIQEDPSCPRATKPVRHNYWACALESRNCYWALVLPSTEAQALGLVVAPAQQE